MTDQFMMLQCLLYHKQLFISKLNVIIQDFRYSTETVEKKLMGLSLDKVNMIYIDGRYFEYHFNKIRKPNPYPNGLNLVNDHPTIDQIEGITLPSHNLTEHQKQIIKPYTVDSPEVKFLLHYYSILSVTGNYMAVPQAPISYAGIKHELFGSPFNHHTPTFCSVLGEYEAVFGSKGSFFHYEWQPDYIYLANPPFIEEIIEQMAIRILDQMDKTANVSVYIVIPVWDTDSQKKYGLKDFKLTFQPYDMMVNSKYYRNNTLLRKEQHMFYDFYTGQHIRINYNHMILLSNSTQPVKSCVDVAEYWRQSVR